ncbi:MAG: type II toxin-antitoxin system Phd/YefM family antitoxin [Bifidobacteriaceae bacterium]|jgi:antitoxin (DNA-binding transcriptional repressor) of toxin-antitoxin stability system|nr:type II toxin-antitoxin system Phd/YefM family antitoxin [Bifidobacteriaceae bacterium]
MRSVGVREFRAQIASLIDGGEAVEVTRHGDRVGVFLPAKRPVAKSPEAFLRAGAAVDRHLAELGLDPDELVAEFDRLRHPNR